MMAAGMFSFYSSYYDALKMLPDEKRLTLYDAMCAYAFEDAEPAFDDAMLAFGWALVDPLLTKSKQRSEAGTKGGRKQAGKQPNNQLGKQTKSTEESNPKSNPKSSAPSYRNGGDRSREELEGIDIEPNEALYQSPLLDGWEKTGTRCRCRNYMYRHPSVEGLHCLNCESLLFEEVSHV